MFEILNETDCVVCYHDWEPDLIPERNLTVLHNRGKGAGSPEYSCALLSAIFNSQIGDVIIVSSSLPRTVRACVQVQLKSV